ncbi:threonine synthase [Thiomicrorhabdus immobilis]|uniref:Threonine synthase n=1 Tax=Thiomicrorhabdus immobilis TaxID=2791037 RepID=A0ABM7MDE6_9GAMM|nr:threonine synthase [Thiomicrorhabdus immobilis]BCN93405.1 threonine synthase [Thiomicrorhabdus immobilis]
MNFIETRGNDGQRPASITFAQAILSPMSSFGGIYSPESLPVFDAGFIKSHIDSDYKTVAKSILALFDVDIDEAVIDEALNLYDKFDDPKNPVPVVKVYDDLYVSELYHGPTRAFKDMALQPFGSVLSAIAEQRDEKYLILAATSGDTGPAALETFKNRKNVQVACLYPDGGTSDVQRLQMVTEDAPNLKVIGIHGDFDDAQSALKMLLTSPAFEASLKEHKISLSAANSVNFGRIIFQTIYHVYSYLELVRQGAIELGDEVYLNVPSGNFGNALGGYYAYKMGLPVKQIHIASNNNNVLTKFITTGEYDLRGASVIPTTSPAMDILKSSNIERILFDLFGAERTKELMLQLDNDKFYKLTAAELAEVQSIFAADFCTDEEGLNYIKQAFSVGYLMCPHTATCFKAYDTCRKDKSIKTIAYATAEWTKFSPIVSYALTGEKVEKDIDALKMIADKAQVAMPVQIAELFDKPISQATVIDKTDIEKEILGFLS